jgi:hypothetical protein
MFEGEGPGVGTPGPSKALVGDVIPPGVGEGVPAVSPPPPPPPPPPFPEVSVVLVVPVPGDTIGLVLPGVAEPEDSALEVELVEFGVVDGSVEFCARPSPLSLFLPTTTPTGTPVTFGINDGRLTRCRKRTNYNADNNDGKDSKSNHAFGCFPEWFLRGLADVVISTGG